MMTTLSQARFAAAVALLLMDAAAAPRASAGSLPTLPGAQFVALAVEQNFAPGCMVACNQQSEITAPGTISLGGAASGGMGGSPLFASATAAGAGYTSAGGLGEVFFDFEWVGPGGPDASLPVDINLTLQTGTSGLGLSGTNTPFAQARFDINTTHANDRGPFQNDVCDFPSSPGECPNSNFTGTLHFQLTPNFDYEAEILAEASAGGFKGSPSEQATAFVDPFIYLGPSYNNLGGYQLVLSAGISNAPAPPGVPEPASLTLLCVGLAGLGFFRRQSLTRPAAPPS